jgi:hypothetical protein
MNAALHRDSTGMMTATMRLPSAIPAEAEARVRIDDIAPADLAAVSAVTMRGPGGALRVEGDDLRLENMNRQIVFENAQSIAPQGGLIRIEVETSHPTWGGHRVSLAVRKKQ